MHARLSANVMNVLEIKWYEELLREKLSEGLAWKNDEHFTVTFRDQKLENSQSNSEKNTKNSVEFGSKLETAASGSDLSIHLISRCCFCYAFLLALPTFYEVGHAKFEGRFENFEAKSSSVCPAFGYKRLFFLFQ